MADRSIAFRYIAPSLAVLVGLIWFGVFAFRNAAGYCWATGRVLSADELIDGFIASHALQGGFWNGADVGRRLGIEEELSIVPYKDVVAFKAQNPACCRVVTGKDWDETGVAGPYFMDKIMGNARVQIAARYNVLIRLNSGKQFYFELENAGWVDACGRFKLAPIEMFRG